MTGSLAASPPPSNVTDIGIWTCPSAKLILSADKAGTPEWHQVRRQGIGASDLAPILNESPWANSTPYGVWIDKLENRLLDETAAMHWGTVLEDAIARDWANARGLTIRNVGTYQSKTHVHALANPDRLVSDGGGLEVKTANAFTKAWADGAWPLHYKRQCEACMAVTGRCHWWCVGLLGGQKLEVRLLKRTDCSCEVSAMHTELVTPEELAGHLDFIESWWQKHIVEFVPPEVGKPVEYEAVDKGSVVDAPLPEAVLADETRWRQIQQEQADLKEELDTIKDRMLFELGNAKRLRAGGRDICVLITKKGSARFNRKGLKKDHPEIEAKYTLPPGDPSRYPQLIGGNDE